MGKRIVWRLAVNIPIIVFGSLLYQSCNKGIETVVQETTPAQQIVQGFETVGEGIKDGLYDLASRVTDLYLGGENE